MAMGYCLMWLVLENVVLTCSKLLKDRLKNAKDTKKSTRD